MNTPMPKIDNPFKKVYNLFDDYITFAINLLKGSALMQIWFVFSLFFGAVITLFAVLNADVVTIKLFWANFELSQSLVILMSAALGSIITIFLGIFSRIKAKIKIRDLNNQLGIANRKIELLNKSVDDHEKIADEKKAVDKKAAENVTQETEKVDQSTPIE